MRNPTAMLSLIALGTAALAHGGVKNADVMARMDNMSAIGAQMKVLGAMAKGQTPFDAAAANAALGEIAAHSGRITGLFETRADDPKSEALPIIWDNWEAFVALADDTQAVATGLAGSIAEKADLGPALGQVGASCKACHSKYRE